MLPGDLAQIHPERGNLELAESDERAAAESERIALELVRTVALPGVPRAGDEVWANPNWEPMVVERVEWMLDPEMDGEAHVTVYLADLDEDEVGAEYGAIELLLDFGWKPRLDL